MANLTPRIGGAVIVSVCAVILLFFVSSPNPRGPADEPVVSASPMQKERVQSERRDPASYTADLPALQAKGRLRILYLAAEIEPRERQLLEQFGRAWGLATEWIPVANPWQLLTSLENGGGDIAASVAEPVHAGPDMPVRDTLSWGVSRPQLVGRDGSGVLTQSRDLSLRQVAVRPRSPAWPRIAAMQKDTPAMDMIEIPDRLSDRQVLERVESGRYDVAVMGSESLQPLLADFPDLKVHMTLGEPEHRRWLVHEEAARLRDSLNRFLNQRHLEMDMVRVYREDLPSLKQRKVLRLITYRSPVNVFFENGRLKGFEYELIKRFAEQHGMRVDVVFATGLETMQSMLKQGRGDVIAASIPRESLSDRPSLQQTRGYNFSAPLLVGRKQGRPLSGPEDLDGRRIYLPAESPWRDVLESLPDQGINIEIMTADPDLNTEAVLFRVARGMYDLTVIGSHELNAEFGRQLNLKTHFALTEPQPHVWSVRRSNTRLLSALNGFIEKEYRRGFYNVLYSKYIENPGPRKANSRQLAEVEQLSPFDRIVSEYAEDYGFDWRLIVAQMYQESRFDPSAVSYAGAEGLMQLLPGTAEELGVEERGDPAHSIRGGIRYLDYLRGRFEDIPQLEDRTWFTLAAYNAGYRRIRQARSQAVEMGLDPDRWFGNVEKAMLALARPSSSNGEWTRLCRCGQTVVYVREIRTLYNNYVRLTQSIRTAETRRPVDNTAPVFN